MKHRHPFYGAVYLVLRRDDEILVVDRQNTGYEDGKYSLVAGHIESQEATFTALTREAKEEAGIDIRAEDMRVVHVMHRHVDAAHDRFDIFIEAKRWEGEPYIAEPEKCSHMMWCPEDRLPEQMIAYIVSALRAIERGEIYSTYGF